MLDEMLEEYHCRQPLWWRIKDKLEDWLIPGWWYRFTYWLDDVYYGIKNHSPYVYTGLPLKAWYDIDTRMLHANMQLLVDFVEKEHGLTHSDWTWNEGHKQAKVDIDEIYAWWKNYPKRQQEIEDSLDKWSEIHKLGIKRKAVLNTKDSKNLDECAVYELKEEVLDPEKVKEAEVLFEKHHKMEQDLIDEETAMLVKLIKIRGYLWT